jgi:hypothetical protein
MKVVRLVLRLFGWLLTPLVAWAASFFGAMAGASLSASLAPMTAIWATVISGGIAALLALLLWLRLLRRSPRLRRTLEITQDGTPVAALEAAPDASE